MLRGVLIFVLLFFNLCLFGVPLLVMSVRIVPLRVTTESQATRRDAPVLPSASEPRVSIIVNRRLLAMPEATAEDKAGDRESGARASSTEVS